MKTPKTRDTAASWLSDAQDDLAEAHDAVRVLVHLSESTILDTETQRAVAWLASRIAPHVADARAAVDEAYRLLQVPD